MRRTLLLSVVVLLAGLALWWAPWRTATDVEPIPEGGAPAMPAPAIEPPATGPGSPPALQGGRVADPAPETNRPAALRGRVLDAATRRPVVDAGVSAVGYGDLRRIETRTGEDGGFVLTETTGSAGAFHLVVTAPGFGRFADDAARPRAEPITILLEPEGAITGRLVQAVDASAVPRYRVLAVRRFERFEDRQSLLNALPAEQAVEGSAPVDDAQGRFRIDGLPSGTYALVFLVEDRHPSLWAGGADADRHGGVPVAPGPPTDVGAVPLARSERIVVRVLEAGTERPLPGASFEGALLVDDREFRFPLRPLEVQGVADYVLALPFDADARLLDASVRVRVEGYAPAYTGGYGYAPDTIFEARLTAPATLRGTVRVDGGDGAGLVVLVRRSVDRRVLATVGAGAGGAFSIPDLPAGIDLEVLVFERAADRLRLTVPVQLRPRESRVLSLGGTEATGVEGRVTVGGKPVAQAWVFVDAGDQRIHCPTDEDGRFRFESLPAGPCPLFVNLDLLETGKAYLTRTVSVEEGRMTRLALDLSLEVRGMLTVRRLDGSLAGPRNRTIVARRPNLPADATDWAPETRTLSDGSFTLRLPAAGPWTLYLDEQDLILDGGPVPVDLAGARGEPKPLRLSATVDPLDGRIELEVRDAETGEVVPDASYQYSWRQTRGAGSSDGKAPVVQEQAGLGTHRFVFAAPVHVRTAIEIEISASQRDVKTKVLLPRSDAVVVIGVEPGSPAESTGLRVEDRIVRYGDTRVRNVTELAAALKATAPTDLVRLEILRGGASQTLTVHGGRLGVRIENTRASP